MPTRPPDTPLEVLFLWHMHQPGYGSARAGRPLLPWVRLHATKDYVDMAERLAARPGLAMTYNVVPSLLEQMAACETGVPDPELDLTRLDPDSAEPLSRARALDRLTIVPAWARAQFPALEDFARRAQAGEEGGLAPAELLDLQVLHLLAWIDPRFYARPVLAPRVDRGRGFSLDDRAAVLDEARALVAEVVPAIRALAAAGSCEVSVSPYYHPILPLLVDVASAQRALPGLPLPREPFSYPQDARAQLVASRRIGESLLGRALVGLWPSEGSVSPEVVELAGEAGYRWLASDEEVLRRSLAPSARHEAQLFRPWRLGSRGLWLFFRDHGLSDRVGFVYAQWAPVDAVNDFFARLDEIRRRWPGPGPARVLVALDGENCWEHYPNDGDEFLERLYDRLLETPWLVTRTPGAVVRELEEQETKGGAVTAGTLAALHSGSWIDGSYRTWIGHPEKNRAWDALARARRALGEVDAMADRDGPPAAAFWNGIEPIWGEDLGGPEPITDRDRWRQAWRHLLIAEGSDWWWWFGDDHFTLDKAIFDRLFREHLIRVYELADLSVPEELAQPLTASERRAGGREISGLLGPFIDGRLTHYYEWDSAALWHAADAGGAMHRGDRIEAIYYGFDRDRLYVRLDIESPESDLVAAIHIQEPIEVTIGVQRDGIELVTDPGLDGTPGLEGAWRRIAELAVPFAALGLREGQTIVWTARLVRNGRPILEAPASGPLVVRVPGTEIGGEFWSV